MWGEVMKEISVKRKYSLVVEPHGSYEKYVVYFDYDSEKGYQIKKRSFKTCDEIAKDSRGKYSLFELDVFTSEMFEDNYDLFRKLGIYQQVHNVYIQFTNSKGYLKRLPVIYDEDLVVDKLSNIRNGKIIDEKQKDEYIEMLISDKTFFNNCLNPNIYKTKTVEELITEIRRVGIYVNQSGGTTESKEWLFMNKQKLKQELSKYHIFRGFVLSEQKTIESKKQKEQTSKITDEPKVKVYTKKPVYPGYEPQEYKQMKLEGFGD